MACRFLLLLFVAVFCGAVRGAGEESLSPANAGAPSAQEAVGRAIGYLQKESAAWLGTRKCAACHHVPMPLWALNEAGRQGYAIDKDFVANTFAATLGSMENMQASGLVNRPDAPPDPRPLAQGVNMGIVFMAVAALEYPGLGQGEKESLGFITDEILKKQCEDGSWNFYLSRPPINESQTTEHVWILLALLGEWENQDPAPQRAAVQRGREWLSAAKASGLLQDQVLQLILECRLATPQDQLRPAVEAVLAQQRPDGGWGQLPELGSDAFATGQTLFALALAGHTLENPEINRAIRFLVSTQAPEGSWPMASRSTPDGSPGSATLLTPITCAAASWSTLGLSRLVPNTPPSDGVKSAVAR